MAKIPGSLKRARCVIPRSANKKEGEPDQHEGAKHKRDRAAQGFHEVIKKMVITIEPQLKGLILRSLTFVRDDIEMAGRSEGCRATWVSSRPQERSHFFKLKFGGNH